MFAAPFSYAPPISLANADVWVSSLLSLWCGTCHDCPKPACCCSYRACMYIAISGGSRAQVDYPSFGPLPVRPRWEPEAAPDLASPEYVAAWCL